MGSPTKFLGSVKQQIFEGKTWHPPNLLSINFFRTRKFLKHWRDPLRSFWVMWYKKLSTKLWCPPSYVWNFSIPEFFWRTDFFRHYETKKVQQRIVICPSYAKIFLKPQFFWNIEWLPHKIFRHCETKTFWRKNVTPPPNLLFMNFFPYEKTSETQKRRIRSFSVLWNKKVSTNLCCTPVPMHENDRYQNFFERQIFLALRGKKSSM